MKSTNTGGSWIGVNSGISYLHMQSICIAPSNASIIYAGTDSLGGASVSGVYKTTNAGLNWTFCPNTIFAQKSIQTIAVHPTNPNIVFVGVFNAQVNSTDGVYKTTDGGATWSVANTGITQKNILVIKYNPLNGNVLYAGSSFTPPSTGPSFIFRSNDGGTTWFNSSTGLPTATTDLNPVRDMFVNPVDTSQVLAVLFCNTTSGGAYLSTNSGQLWTRKSTGLPNSAGNVYRACIIRPGSTAEFYVGNDNSTAGGVYRTTNAGDSWVSFNGGTLLTNYATRTFIFRTTGDTTLYTGVGSTSVANPPGKGIYEYSWVPVGIADPGTNMPTEFALYQNYPNPFNPVTTIKYDVAKTGTVTLNVYDITGKFITSLVNGQKVPGHYNVIFNGRNLTSGIYLYDLIENGNRVDTKRMIILK
jgi:photosystem II stability/assembly factor-like uncharacterized protein